MNSSVMLVAASGPSSFGMPLQTSLIVNICVSLETHVQSAHDQLVRSLLLCCVSPSYVKNVAASAETAILLT